MRDVKYDRLSCTLRQHVVHVKWKTAARPNSEQESRSPERSCHPVSIDTPLSMCEGIGFHPLWDAQKAI